MGPQNISRTSLEKCAAAIAFCKSATFLPYKIILGRSVNFTIHTWIMRRSRGRGFGLPAGECCEPAGAPEPRSQNPYYPCVPCICLSPLTPRAFCQKRIFGHFGNFPGWIWAKLVPIYSKRHLQHDSKPFFSLASRLTTFLLGHAQKSKFVVFGRESDLRL